jgi:preprotein translocase subunit SecG
MTSSLLLLLLVLACPLLMWLMMRGGHGHGHGGHGGHHAATIDGHHGAESTDDLLRRRAELDREITARERVEAP